MSTLFGNNISQTYQGLIKLADSTTGVTATTQSLQDGLGNNIPIQVSNTTVNISGSFLVNGQPVSIETGSFATTGSNTFIGNQTITGSLFVSGSEEIVGVIQATDIPMGPQYYAPTLFQGVGQTAVAYDQFVNGGNYDSLHIETNLDSGSKFQDYDLINNNLNTWLQIPTNTGNNPTPQMLRGLGITGSLSVFSGNTTLGNTVISGSLIGNSVNGGLIKIQNEANRSGSVQFNITGSSPISQSNVIFGNPTGPAAVTQTGSVVISGSNNIIFNGYRIDTIANGQGTYGYIGGNGNIGNTIPTLGTGSLLRPTINQNALQSFLNLQFTTSSLGTPTFQSNLIYGGVTINHQSGSVNYNGNGTLGGNVTSTQNITTANTTAIITNNLFTGNLTSVLNHNSSSIIYQGNIGPVVIQNNYSSSVSPAVDNINVNQNLFNGFGETIIVTGSNSATRRTFNSNLISGRSNLVNSNYSGSFTGGHLISTAILGQQLIVSASNTSTTIGGSTFVGRYNATGSLQESSQETVFVVGTGTSDGNRRNALRIDNNNNSNFTGSVNISGSLLLNGVAVGGDRNGLITTGSIGQTQYVTGGLNVNGNINVTGAFAAANIVGTGVSNFYDNVNITGNTNITGSLTLNGVAVSNDRNGLITTGSFGGAQSITGSLSMTNGGITILGAGANLNIQSGSLQLNNDQQSSISNPASGRNVMYVDNLYSNFFFGNVPKGQNNRFSGDTNNFILSPTYSDFQTGSKNLIFAVGNTFFNSGSNNIFIGDGQPFGNNVGDSLYIGMNENNNQSIITKRGGGPSFPIQLGFPTQITGSLNVSNGAIITGSLNVSNKINELKIWTGSLNTNSIGIGDNTLNSQTGSSLNNIAIGGGALQDNVIGANVVAIGGDALANSLVGFNLAIGASAFNANTTGEYNVGIGQSAFQANTIGAKNTAIGWNSGVNNLTGSTNTIIGAQALSNNVNGSGNIAIGHYAGYYSTGSNGFYIGNDNYGGLNAEQEKSMMYGEFNGTTANQTLRINANTKIIGDVMFSSGSNKTMGTVALDGGNPGTITVSNSLVTTGSMIFLTKQTLVHPNGYVAVSSKGSGTFTITSNHNGDSDVVAYQIINPA
jgi:hypothetical protein